MMTSALERLLFARAVVITAYKRFETPIVYFFKFIVGYFIFTSLNGWFAALGIAYSARLEQLSSVLLAAVLTAIVPPTWVFMLIWLFITLHIFAFSLEIAVIAGLALLCLIFFYIRIFPKESWLIILLLVCYKLKIPYFVPLYAGAFVGVSSIGALIIGAMVWYIAPQFAAFAAEGSSLDNISVLSLPQTFADTLKAFLELLSSNDGWVRVSLVFAITVIVVWFVSRLPVPYSMEAGIGAGFLTLFIGGIAGGIAGGFIGFFFSVVFSTLFAYVCKFFYIVVDYSATERVSFMDDDYLYYVKAVPKIKE